MVEQLDDGWGEENLAVENNVDITVTPNLDVGPDNNEADFCVRLTPPKDNAVRVPIDLCCCVDISASMRAAATYEDENGNDVDEGLCILDIVKHAIKTVIHTLSDEDRMSVVVFSDKAEICLKLTTMND